MVKKVQENKEDEEKQGEGNKRLNPDGGVEPKPKRIKNLYRQPTTSELNQLQETENLFNSNLFRLQINEVLQEVKIKEKTAKKFQTWFEKLKQNLLSIQEDDTEYDLSESVLRKKLKVKVPINEKLNDIKVAFKFHKFTDVKVVGSYDLECAINSKLCVDIAVTIPSETFTKNDTVNYRYHKKYAYYLAFIAAHLTKNDSVTKLKYSLHDNCESKPILTFKPEGKLSNVTIKLRLVCDESSFKLGRFTPSRNNLRESWFFSEKETEELGPATPFYNSTVLQDLTHEANEVYLKEILSNSTNLRQAIVLLKIWLRQRQLNVSGYVVNMLVAYLVQIRRINNIMSSYQIVRNVWIFVSSTDWSQKGITLFKGTSDDIPAIEEFHSTFPVVFLDKTGFYNVCWNMSKGTYAAWKRESTLAVQMLDNPNINSFIPLFMTTQRFILQFDDILRFKDTPTVKEAVYSRINKQDKLNYGIDKTQLIVKKIYDILSQGVGNRCSLILHSEKSHNYSWPVKESWKRAEKNKNDELRFGLCLNGEEALNTIDKGPAANLPEAESFRAFWGEKSELRRFQDGGITETVVWSGDTLAERRGVVRQIVCYLMRLKFGVEKEIFYIANQLDSVLARKEYRPVDFEYGTGEEATVKVLQAFDSLRKDLRNLTDLPLYINSVYGTSPVFSYGDPLPPLAHPSPASGEHWYREKCCLIKDGQNREKGFEIRLPKANKTSRAIIEFGHSGKWPGDLEAFRRLKAAFNVQIAENLASQFSLVTHAYPEFVHVVKDGYVFRLEIAHQKEVNLMRRYVERGVVKYQETRASEEVHRRSILLPRIRGALHGLHQKSPAYGPTVSLVKRWLSSHLLDASHFPHVAVELLVAYLFVRPEPYVAPVQPTTAFVAYLSLVAGTDWTTQALVLNFNDELKRDEIMEIEQKVTTERSSLPPLCIVTSHDLECPGTWTRYGPTDQVLVRVQTLARSALRYLETSLLEETRDNVLGIFVPSLTGYDVLIYLNPQYVPHRAESVSQKPLLNDVPSVGDVTVIPVVDFDPVERYLLELRSAYDEFALFFHDSYGGDVVAVLWKPGVRDEQDFQVLKSNGMKPMMKKTEVKCTTNLDAFVEDFKMIGEGLVKDVVIC